MAMEYSAGQFYAFNTWDQPAEYVLNGHFGPIYLHQVSKDDDEIIVS